MSGPKDQAPDGSTPTERDTAAIQALGAHMARYFGPIGTSFQEVHSTYVHVDVHTIPPTPQSPYWTLFTTGMSERPMAVPPGAEHLRFAELLLFLPAEWRVDAFTARPPPADLERWWWPVHWLKVLARVPHEQGAWLGIGHHVPNGDPPQPLAAGTALAGWLLLPPNGMPEEAWTVPLPDGRQVLLYALNALHPGELSLVEGQGLGPLLQAFQVHGVSDVLDPARPPVV
jgi:hypothetical protein